MNWRLFTGLILSIVLVFQTTFADMHARKEPTRAKKNAMALCVALLTTSSVSAVVLTKMSGQNHTPGFGMRTRLYRDRSALAVFLGRGLKKKFDRSELSITDGEIEIVAEHVGVTSLIDVEQLMQKVDEEMLDRSISVSESREDGYVKGYIVLPSLVATFEFLAPQEESREFIIRSIGTNQLLAKGKVQLRAPMAELSANL